MIITYLNIFLLPMHDAKYDEIFKGTQVLAFLRAVQRRIYFIIILKRMHLHSVVNSDMFPTLQEVNKAIREEYLRRVFDSIQENDSLEELQPGIGSCMYLGSYLL